MSAPRLEVNLRKVHHNASTLVNMMANLGISVTGITKTILGSPEIADAMVRSGMEGIGDSRIENIIKMLDNGIDSPMTMIRSPMLSQVNQIVRHVDISFNTELAVIRMLSEAAIKTNRLHGIVLMVELGDLREGIMFDDVEEMVGKVLLLPGVVFKGIGTNLACQSGVIPNELNMARLSTLTNSLEAKFDLTVGLISGGNSANLPWALSGANTGRINNLRLGESILLGREPLQRKPIEGLYVDAFSIIAEVIESKIKPAQPWGEIGQTAFGFKTRGIKTGSVSQTILAIGQQDVDPDGLTAPYGVKVSGASGDHLMLTSEEDNLEVGAEIKFQPNYSALLRAMSSSSIKKVMK